MITPAFWPAVALTLIAAAYHVLHRVITEAKVKAEHLERVAQLEALLAETKAYLHGVENTFIAKTKDLEDRIKATSNFRALGK